MVETKKETCSECGRHFNMTEHNARFVQVGKETKVLCGSCAEDSPLMW